MVIHNLNIFGIVFGPAKHNPKLIIDSNTVKLGQIPLEGFQFLKLLFKNQFEFLDSGFRRNDEHFLP